MYLADSYNEFPYSIYEPSSKFQLKKELREISGLTYFGRHSLLCINDEKGIIYQYNWKKKEITKKYKFGKSGDYEGIELVDSLVYVLRSDGTIYYVKHLKAKENSTNKKVTFLNAGNNTEGLGYDPTDNALLVACKGLPGKNNAYQGKRAIYKYYLKDHFLAKTPAFLIDQEQIRNILGFNSYTDFSVKLLETFIPSEGDLTFQPSAVAINPLTGNLYVLGSVGKLLLVIHPDGVILAAVKLKRKIFRQPEGICFAPDGTMFISNEGRGGKATILKFKPKK
ncbi:SdiA-regulated domain-containing protein [Ancylomarina longa]|uniref:Uncharacterized protein n=1 Tax=Ancylomarina longa TaxID=2487017 RepID=A0A434AZK9_9BACT|nr:SdiA-regulated domain-containing protein [Ancylomarina longa]RUT80058.1 hypothetical protein DLK05_01490 [Ancylomarina longa]